MHARIASCLVLAAMLVGAAPPWARADLENNVFLDENLNIRMAVPRGWRASEHATYPGIVLRMRRARPKATMLFASSVIDAATYCAWPAECRAAVADLAGKASCALATRLRGLGFSTGLSLAGPKPVAGSLPTTWLEYDDGKAFSRQAMAVDGLRLHSLVMSARSDGDRSASARAFETVLRSMRPVVASTTTPGGDNAIPFTCETAAP